MSTTLFRRLSLRALLVLGLATVGLTAFAGAASATFTLSTGTLTLTDGSTTGTPPSGGSWVTLPTDDPLASPNYFSNAASTAASPQYTLINGSASSGLQLGTTQASGIFGALTSFGGPSPTYDFFAKTTVAPTLTFDGSATGSGTRALTAGNLSGFAITYGGNDYDVSTTEATARKHIVPLNGSITGDATNRRVGARIVLDWTSDLVEPGFDLYQARFHLEGIYRQ